MFRKNYKEAMDDIKPNAAFVESVIASSKERRPPLHTRYVKYAAAAAAAVVVVSGTILSMPLWNRVEDSKDGVIYETAVTETAAPSNAAEPQPTADTGGAAAEKPETTPAPEGGGEKPSQNSIPSSAFGSISSNGTSAKAQSEPQKNVPQQTEGNNTAEQIPQQTEENSLSGKAAESADNGDVTVMRSIVMGETDEQVKENKMPADMAPYEEKSDVSYSAAALQPEIADADIPAPTGYRCRGATPRGYTFVNDNGAVITVTINYGGEEREPYIEENGDNIYAVFTSFGLSVTINASGAERRSVEEIINSLR